jgi:16S rRNA (uracil1498-N3)-methyltransferase
LTLFYAPDFTPSQPTLPDDEAHHAFKVLRLAAGAVVNVTDGHGNLHEVKIADADWKKPRLQVLRTQTDFGKRDYRIHMAVAPTKNADRTEWLVEKCVELGVDEISFVACERSERRHFKTDRLEKIAVAAMKQSLKAYLPVVRDMIPFANFVKQTNAAQRFIAYLDEEKKAYLAKAATPGGDYCVLIGPEGDFSPKEVSFARQYGFEPVSLGNSRLRTETAAMAACHIFNIVNERC